MTRKYIMLLACLNNMVLWSCVLSCWRVTPFLLKSHPIPTAPI